MTIKYMNIYDIKELVKKSNLKGEELRKYELDLKDEMNYNLKQNRQEKDFTASNYPAGYTH